MRNRKLVEVAQQLSQKGLKNIEIARNLHESTSKISRWCRKSHKVGVVTNTSNYQEKERSRLFNLDSIRLGHINEHSAKILLSTLYWCEGCKYPGTSRLEFVSSDETMQQTFITLLRLAYPAEIVNSKFRVMLQLHSTHNIPALISHWSTLLDIPPHQFLKPHITVGKDSRYRHIYNGTCSIRYHDYRLLLRIMGCYTQVGLQITAKLYNPSDGRIA